MRQLTDSEMAKYVACWQEYKAKYETEATHIWPFEYGFTAAIDYTAAQIAALQAENARLWAVYQDVYSFLESEGFMNITTGQPPTPYERKVSELIHKLLDLFNEKYGREGEAARRVLGEER